VTRIIANAVPTSVAVSAQIAHHNDVLDGLDENTPGHRVEDLIEDAPVKVRLKNLRHFRIVFLCEADLMLFRMRWL
jgi:hypothetical protein